MPDKKIEDEEEYEIELDEEAIKAFDEMDKASLEAQRRAEQALREEAEGWIFYDPDDY